MLRHPLARSGPTLLLLVALAATIPLRAQTTTEQYRTPAGKRFQSFADAAEVTRAERAWKEQPTLERALALGAAQSAARRYREAIETYSLAIREHPDAAVLYRWRGHRRLTLRQFLLARGDLEIATQLDSTLYGAWYHLGVVRFVDGDFPGAADAFRRALPLAPDPAERAGSVDWLWQSLARQRDTIAAVALLASRPDSIPAGNAYATRLRLYRGEIGPDEVLGAADTAAVQRTTLAFGVGSWYLARGDSAQARRWFERAVAAEEGWPAFGFIAAEAELDGRTSAYSWRRVIPDVMGSACLGRLAPAVLRRRLVELSIQWHDARTTSSADRHVRQQFLMLLGDAAELLRSELGAVPGSLPSGEPRFDWRETDGEMTIIARRDGRLTTRAPRSDDARNANRYAVLNALSAVFDRMAGGAPPRLEWPDGLAGDSLMITVTLTPPLARPMTAPPVAPPLSLMLQALDAPPTSALPLFHLEAPSFRGVEVKSAVPPRFPDGALAGGATGSVRLRFTVDTLGLADPRSVREFWPLGAERPRGVALRHYETFLEAAARSVERTKHHPAELGGCKVPSMVMQDFVFEQRPPSP